MLIMCRIMSRCTFLDIIWGKVEYSSQAEIPMYEGRVRVYSNLDLGVKKVPISILYIYIYVCVCM